MKTPNRNFVVEYKGTRKRSQAQPKSIWGDIDLRSAAQSVEADGMLPKEVPSVEAAPVHEAVPHLSTVEPTLDSSDVEQTDLAEVDEEIASAKMLSDDHTDLSQADAQEQSAPEEHAISPRKTRGKDRRPRRRHGQDKSPSDASPYPGSNPGQKDELAQLDAENRSLRRQLSVKLRDENKVLAAMLRRLR